MTSSFPLTPSTHSLPSSSSSATDKAESAFLARTRSIHILRLGLASTLAVASTALIACEAIPLRHHQHTKTFERVGLALWPLDFDLRPTLVALVAGALALVGCLGVLGLGVVPFPKSKITPLNALTSLSALTGFVLALAGLVLEIYKPSASYPVGFSQGHSLKDWTCKWASAREGVVVQGGSGAGVRPPVHFERDCRLAKAGFGLLAAVLGLEVLMAGVGVVGVWVAFVVRRERRVDEVERQGIVPKA